MKKTLVSHLLLSGLFLASPALSDNNPQSSIIKYLVSDEIEIREDGTEDYRYLKLQELPEPAVPILRVDAQYLQIQLADTKKVWLSSADVVLSNEPDILNICQESVISRSMQEQSYGIRGVGENCKKQ
ncbi:hypothetical protein [Endozoicomonas sp. ONNA2]|uniref:hypothetical protein n=1 Tax=Endozoicomonas sp. ONNA2 TaxID=2828741 RepID=UPI0021490407|nr:hypothetical protein [Endozoicomonas sp. ONNA2]